MLNVATISPLAPGATGSAGGAAVVQPQDGRTVMIFTGLSPLFVYLKCATAVASVILGCNSTNGFSQTSAAFAGPTPGQPNGKDD